jgi:Protein of unknown function (DUF2934)
MSDQNLFTSQIRLHSDEEAETATLAYRFYCEEGCPEGKADEHWMRAEREVRGRSKSVESEPRQSESESVPAARGENPPLEE